MWEGSETVSVAVLTVQQMRNREKNEVKHKQGHVANCWAAGCVVPPALLKQNGTECELIVSIWLTLVKMKRLVENFEKTKNLYKHFGLFASTLIKRWLGTINLHLSVHVERSQVVNPSTCTIQIDRENVRFSTHLHDPLCWISSQVFVFFDAHLNITFVFNHKLASLSSVGSEKWWKEKKRTRQLWQRFFSFRYFVWFLVAHICRVFPSSPPIVAAEAKRKQQREKKHRKRLHLRRFRPPYERKKGTKITVISSEDDKSEEKSIENREDEKWTGLCVDGLRTRDNNKRKEGSHLEWSLNRL